MDTIREQIAQALVARLDTITTSSGYNFTFKDSVNRAVRVYDEEELPAITIWIGEEFAEKDYRVSIRNMSVSVEATYLCSDETITHDAIANLIIADVQKAMGTNDATLKALVDDISEDSLNPVYPDQGSDVLTVKVSYIIKYRILKEDPYTQP